MEEVKQEIEALKQEVASLKDVLYKGIIEPIEKDYNDRKYNEAVGIWTERFKDKLSPYLEKLKATEGDDFDLYKASYDAWNETDADPEQFVGLLIQSIEESLEPLAKVFGVEKEDLDATITIEDGEVADVQADTEPEEGEGADEVSDEVSDEGAGEGENAEESAVEEELSEEEQFQRDLDEAYEKMKERRY